MFTINDVGTHRQINGELVALTEDERAAIRDKWNAAKEMNDAEAVIEAEKISAKQSCRDKLKALGLSDIEVDALT